LFQSLQARTHRPEIGEHAAQPPLADIVHLASAGGALNRFLSLALSAHEDDVLTGRDHLDKKLLGNQQAPQCLFDVNDMDVTAFCENKWGHSGIPPAYTVSKMHPCVNQFPSQFCSHKKPPKNF
jgi:hypothetical protein